MLLTMIGSSTITARPMASVFSATPGPLVVVIASAPLKAAPIADVIPAISSSAWNVRTPKFLYIDSSWRMSLAGVIGYEPRKSGRPDWRDAATYPRASALLPEMLRQVHGECFAGGSAWDSWN